MKWLFESKEPESFQPMMTLLPSIPMVVSLWVSWAVASADGPLTVEGRIRMRGSSGRAAGTSVRELLAASRLSAALERGSLDQAEGGCLPTPLPRGDAAAVSTSPASSSKPTRRTWFNKAPSLASLGDRERKHLPDTRQRDNPVMRREPTCPCS